MHLFSENLKDVAHGFFTRKGGVSTGIYASLNCGRGSADDKTHVAENRQRVASALNTTPSQLCTLYQIHSADVITIEQPWESPLPRADAMVTKTSGIALGVLTADCAPVLFADTHTGVIGAAHAGWRGAFSGVVEATIKSMCALGAKHEHIAVAIGPCIGFASYEVDTLFRDKFLEHNPAYTEYFRNSKNPQHFFFDLKGFITGKLVQAGIININLLENDTYVEEDSFFSFRRATHRREPDYGRQISAIMLR